MRDCQVKKKVKMIKAFKAKQFGNFATDEGQYEPTDDKSIEEVGF